METASILMLHVTDKDSETVITDILEELKNTA